MRIEMHDIDKYFASNQVLKKAHFTLEDAEIHALIGENGAGKSTLMKILTGVYSRDGGEILVDGVPTEFHHPREAEEAGIVFIYQELNIMPDLTVQENLFMGNEKTHKFGVLDKKAMRLETENIMKRLGVSILPDMIMANLSIGQQQMVEIAKALLGNAKVIIMDEPTAALTPSETETLFEVARSLRESGVGIIYISHRMEEIFELCDTITVLRDGTYVDSKPIGETDMNDIVRMMIGRDIGDHYPPRNAKIGDVVLSVDHITKEPVFRDITFEVRAGEVLGVSGLIGAGRTEIMDSIFVDPPIDSGSVFINQEQVHIHSPKQAKEHGIGFITEDRKNEGLLLDESITKNIALTNLQRISKYNVISGREETHLAEQAMEDFSIRASGIGQETSSLSGGNQQKVVLAKWIYTNPKILILDEPTRGVDIGAKKEIYTIINDLAEQGVAIIFISSDLPEVLGMGDRIMVIHEGTVAGCLDKEKATQENVMLLATGGKV